MSKRPTISHFYNITIEMEAKEDYLPHIYARFGNHEAMFSANSGERMSGAFPEKEGDLVTAWVLLHQKELKNNWEKSLNDSNYSLKDISPLV